MSSLLCALLQAGSVKSNRSLALVEKPAGVWNRFLDASDEKLDAMCAINVIEIVVRKDSNVDSDVMWYSLATERKYTAAERWINYMQYDQHPHNGKIISSDKMDEAATILAMNREFRKDPESYVDQRLHFIGCEFADNEDPLLIRYVHSIECIKAEFGFDFRIIDQDGNSFKIYNILLFTEDGTPLRHGEYTEKYYT